MSVPVPQAEFTPVSIGSGLGASLATALGARESLAIVLPHGSESAVLEEKVYSMVKAAAPGTAVLARGRATLDKLLEERGELPYRVTQEAAGSDILGRPIFLPKEHPLQTEWLTQKKTLKGAKALLVVRPLTVDDQRRKQLRAARTGDCTETLAALQAGLDKAQEYFFPYLQPINAALARAFARHLQPVLPFFQEELARTANEDQDPEASRCAAAYTELLRAYSPCAQEACPLSPVAGAVTGGVVGLPEPTVFVPPSCPTASMRNLRREIADLAQSATAEVLPNLDGPWVAELLRQAGLAAIQDILVDTCKPRHRRLSPDNLTTARTIVADYLADLSTREIAGAWQTATGQERLTGQGTVAVLAKVVPTGYDPLARAAESKKQLRQLDQCTGAPEQVYQAVVIDVGTSEILFLGLFFEEELLCPGLPPA